MESLDIQDELLKVNRRLEKLEKSLDLLNQDRDILETIQSRLTALEEQVKLSRENDNTARRDIKEEIQMSGDRVVAAVETQIEKKVKISSVGLDKTNMDQNSEKFWKLVMGLFIGVIIGITLYMIFGRLRW